MEYAFEYSYSVNVDKLGIGNKTFYGLKSIFLISSGRVK